MPYPRDIYVCGVNMIPRVRVVWLISFSRDEGTQKAVKTHEDC